MNDDSLLGASTRGDLKSVKRLIPRTRLNISDTAKRTPLHMACYKGNLPIIEELLKAGFNPNAVDMHGSTPLLMASQKGYVKVAEMLLRYGADPNIVDRAGRTPLYEVSFYGHLIIFGLLLANGADPTIADIFKKAPLFWTRTNHFTRMTEILEDYFPSLQNLSMRSIRGNRIDIIKVPKELYFFPNE